MQVFGLYCDSSNPFNFFSFKELRCGLGLKHASRIQYVIVYQKSCILIWNSISCYL